jgi:hypothetical protein
MSGNVTVRIGNTYVCGRSSGGEHQVPAPALNVSEEDLDDWWQEHVEPLTGDGHPCAADEHSLYEATIIASHGRPELIGQTWAAEDQ